MPRHALLITLAILATANLHASDALDAIGLREIDDGKAPSLAIGIVTPEGLVDSGAWGWASVADRDPATTATRYAIGSITKVFTTTLLADMRDDGVLRLDDPVQPHLPGGVTLPSLPGGDPAITFRHLATHTSGLPRLPVNVVSRGGDAYGGYPAELLWEGFNAMDLATPAGWRVAYSNLGTGLLGEVLARLEGTTYPELVQRRLFDPLGMDASALVRPEATDALPVATGYTKPDGETAAPDWTLGVLAPAGAIWSSVADMARFAQLHLATDPADPHPVLAPATVREMQRAQRLMGPEWRRGIGLGWILEPRPDTGEVVWHNGSVSGFSSYLVLSPANRVAVVVLTNHPDGVESIGDEVLALAIREHGKPSSLEPTPGLRSAAERLAAGFAKTPPDGFDELFHSEFRAAVPFFMVRGMFMAKFAQHGTCKSWDIVPTREASTGEVIFRFEDGATVRADVGVDTARPSRVIYFMMK